LRLIARHRETVVASEQVQAMRIKTPSVETRVMNLSGGNQQKVVLGKWLALQPKVIIFDEPTRGIDVGAKYEIYTIIDELARNGEGILMISSEMPELLGMCDRIYVMNEGRLVAELGREEASQERIMRAIVNATQA
jgi:putative multiple sugar transport system ATP-binding protein